MLLAKIQSRVSGLLRHPLAMALFVVAIAMIVNIALGSLSASAACNTSDLSIESGASCAQGNGQPSNLVGDGGVFNRITSILLFIVGAVAVIMLILGGIRYVVSGGDQTQVTAAKNTILYAIIGIVIALLAYAAVRFVTTSLLNGVG